MMVNMNVFGTRLRELREEKELNQIELSKILNVVNSTISQYEAGNRKPDSSMLEKIATYFETSIDYLVGRTDAKSSNETPFDYSIIYKQRDEGDAYITIRELEVRYNLSKETVFKMIDDVHEHYKNQRVVDSEGGVLTHGPNSPGSGVLPEDDKGRDV